MNDERNTEAYLAGELGRVDREVKGVMPVLNVRNEALGRNIIVVDSDTVKLEQQC